MAMTLITTNTFSGASSSTFTSSIDSTYKLYIFKLIDIHTNTDDAYFGFQAKTNGTYNTSTTSTFFRAAHNEADDSATLTYVTAMDQANGTALQNLTDLSGSDADASAAGELHLFNPSNSTYVKHYYATLNSYYDGTWGAYNAYIAGYFNTTSAINGVEFKADTGTITGTIKMYGVG